MKKTRNKIILLIIGTILSAAVLFYFYKNNIEVEKPKVEPTTAVVEITTKTTTETTKQVIESLGVFKIYHYCSCEKCCEKTDGITATGTIATEGLTIAVDPSVIPYGTKVLINGEMYIAEDCGGDINEKTIDIYVSSHEKASRLGTYYTEVFKINVK